MKKHALSTHNQQIIVAKYMSNHGSINRYEAEPEGVCSLAARILDLKDQGFKIKDKREKAKDSFGIEHDRISRYWFDKSAMTQEQITKLNKLLGKS